MLTDTQLSTALDLLGYSDDMIGYVRQNITYTAQTEERVLMLSDQLAALDVVISQAYGDLGVKQVEDVILDTGSQIVGYQLRYQTLLSRLATAMKLPIAGKQSSTLRYY